MSTFDATSPDHFTPPPIAYLPPRPVAYDPAIGLIGAGGIAATHLSNYQKSGFRVTAIADEDLARADARRTEFFPHAAVYSDYRSLLDDPTIEVVDITTHAAIRGPIIRAALEAGKHVLSQKPSVLDLDEGDSLIALAREKNLQLAVNKNGRWAPRFSYLRQAVAAGLIGEVITADFSVLWDHTWMKGLPAFEGMRHLILYDFPIHWFDLVTCIMGGARAESVRATCRAFPSQQFHPAALAACVIDYPHAQSRMSFNGHTLFGVSDSSLIVGTSGTLQHRGPSLLDQHSVDIHTAQGRANVPLQGEWFTNGFVGTMGELLLAIEQGCEPEHSAANNLRSLVLCFAEIASADSGQPVNVGTVRSLPEGS